MKVVQVLHWTCVRSNKSNFKIHLKLNFAKLSALIEGLKDLALKSIVAAILDYTSQNVILLLSAQHLVLYNLQLRLLD